MLKKAAEWYELNLRTITLDLVKEESRERILSRNEMGLLVANAEFLGVCPLFFLSPLFPLFLVLGDGF